MGIVRTQGLAHAPDAQAAGLEDHRRRRAVGKERRGVAAVLVAEAIGDVLGHLHRSPFVIPELFRLQADTCRRMASAETGGATSGAQGRADPICTGIGVKRHGDCIGDVAGRL